MGQEDDLDFAKWLEERFAQPGHIRSVFYGQCERSLTPLIDCSLFIDFECMTQGFGVALKPEFAPDYRRELLATFNVADMERLTGMPCIAYRCFNYNNEPIEAIGPNDGSGKVFSFQRWAQKFDFYKLDELDPFERRANRIRTEIALFTRRIAEEEERLATLKQDYRPIPESK